MLKNGGIKLHKIKEIIGNRDLYFKMIKSTELNQAEKDIVRAASVKITKNKILNENEIDKVYDILIENVCIEEYSPEDISSLEEEKGLPKNLHNNYFTKENMKVFKKISIIVFSILSIYYLVNILFSSKEIVSIDKIVNRNGLAYKINSNEPFSGISEEYYTGRNHQLGRKVNYKNGKQDGTTTTWYENGQQKAEVNYQNDKQDGIATAWWENGQKKTEVNYKNGKQDGITTTWYENGNGQKEAEGNYKNGKLDGITTGWYENGQKEAEVNYKNGKLDGITTGWYENGQKKTEVNYKNGKRDGITTGWYVNGQKKIEGNYKNGEVDGIGSTWYEDGQKKTEVNYKNGKRDGIVTTWNENGQKNYLKE